MTKFDGTMPIPWSDTPTPTAKSAREIMRVAIFNSFYGGSSGLELDQMAEACADAATDEAIAAIHAAGYEIREKPPERYSHETSG